MEYTLKVIAKTNIKTIQGDKLISLLAILKQHNFYINAPCNGKGKCGKCNVKATGTFFDITTKQEITVYNKNISSCLYCPIGNCEITIPDQNIDVYSSDCPILKPNKKHNLGLAVDFGTTTIEAVLYDLKTGICLNKVHQTNKQAMYGSDVISRIQEAHNGKLDEFTTLLLQQLENIAQMACSNKQVKTESIDTIVITGNTIMEYFFSHIDPYQLAIPPFKADHLFGQYCLEFNSSIFNRYVKVYLADCVSAYIGSDIVAGCLYNGFDNNDKLTLYIDLGTNGEIVLGKNNKYFACSTAAGPAFEAQTISCGAIASVGAINKVEVNNNILSYSVISSDIAAGICGSGLIDAVACFKQLNLIGKSGIIKNRSFIKNAESCIAITDKVYVSQSDIRNVLLAKGAIMAGIEILLEEYGCQKEDIEEIILAGNFGSYVNIDNCVKIGLLPQIENAKIKAIGNGSLYGGAMLLDESNIIKVKEIVKSIEYIDLSTYDKFTEFYAKNISLK